MKSKMGDEIMLIKLNVNNYNPRFYNILEGEYLGFISRLWGGVRVKVTSIGCRYRRIYAVNL